MKGLKKIPSFTQRLKAYKALQFSPHSVQIKELALWSQWVRLDPRLGEILVRHLGQFWSSIKPQELNQTLQKQVWPSAFGVLIEQTLYYLEKSKTKAEDKKCFCRWSKHVMRNITPAPDELFFIGLYKAGGKKIKEECLYSIQPYRKWGYFAKDWLINKAGKGPSQQNSV